MEKSLSSTSLSSSSSDTTENNEIVSTSLNKSQQKLSRRSKYLNPRATPDSIPRNISACFCFTIAQIPQNKITKEQIFQMLDPYTTQIVIGLEKHKNELDHFHVYYRLKNKKIFDEAECMRELEKLLPDVNFTICHQRVKKYEDAVQYCTKLDRHPAYKGVDTKKFRLIFYY